MLKKIPMGIDKGKYHINHKDTENDEVSVSLTLALSNILDRQPSDIDIDRYFNMEGLNQIFQRFNRDSPISSKITFHIEEFKVEIYSNNDITITPSKLKKLNPIPNSLIYNKYLRLNTATSIF